MNRFTDNQDGTIFDSHTNLLWLKDANHFKTSMLWKEAVDACKTLEISGGGWRLPEVKELLSLVDYSRYNPALPQGHPFSNVQSSYYWSATTDAYNIYYAWVVYMYNGSVDYGYKADDYNGYVWPVRDV